ncbi:dihydrolipoyl dehydrogenase family protein [Marinilabilia rubra]|uniref:NAD(P)/FAD-dependent oxidoreductase n=1 Tax=Marinilabilia rubra TaxID=2162893 RepID=A0A2U2BEA2_9BACT|nr:NAD(P)/FAD-dependent oxidoreductase [Marinilabilia rubra]PWE01400.1 NAD(P)/FAD-dependent oxidoreductase [Marinilabilia rubra]
MPDIRDNNFDIVIIGSGPGGFSAANRALDYGLHVCLIEKSHLGGAGVINGVLTSKTMYELSMDYSVAARIDRGYRASALSVDYNQVRHTVLEAAREKQYQMRSQIETFTNKPSLGSISLVNGHARFLNENVVEVSSKNEAFEISGKHFIIATGASPRQLPDVKTDGKRIITSDDILSLSRFPERMLIIGSGIIGCEFATIFSNFNQTQVHLLDRSNRVLPYEDDDVSRFVSNNLEKNGVEVHHTAQLRCIREHPDHLEVVLDYAAGHSKVIEVDLALVAIGRVPNTKDLGLENIGVSPDKRGMLCVKDSGQLESTKDHKNIYAIGDITGHTQLYSVAEFQGRMAVESIMNNVCYTPDYSNMSTLMFFKPEVAAVGANEKTLQEKSVGYRAVFYSNALVNRAIAMRNTHGFVKILVSNDNKQRILGMRAAGPQASAFIVAVAHLINQGNSVSEVLKIFYPHPSITEGIQECMRALASKSIYKPLAFPDHIIVSEWNPGDPITQTPKDEEIKKNK